MTQRYRSRFATTLGVAAVVMTACSGATQTAPATTVSNTSTTVFAGESFSLPEGEIFLSPANDVGPSPFSPVPFAPTPLPELATAPETTVPGETVPAITLPPAQESNIQAVDGGAAGKYGGTLDNDACDVAKMKQFLESNAAQAEAFVAALNTDPTLKAPGGALTVANLSAYLDTLTPLILLQDTRVTMFGFTGSQGTPPSRQSVLQKGGAVLVDQFGVPRSKCYCGNPLTAPEPSQVSLKFVGTPWPGFDPAQLQVISPSPQPILSFTIVDPLTGTTFVITPGPNPSIQMVPATTTTVPATTVAPATTAAPTTVAPATTAAPAVTTAPATIPAGAVQPPAGDFYFTPPAGRTAPDFTQPERALYAPDTNGDGVVSIFDELLRIGPSTALSSSTIDQYYELIRVDTVDNVQCPTPMTRTALGGGVEFFADVGCTFDPANGDPLQPLPDFFHIVFIRPNGKLFSVSGSNRAEVEAVFQSVTFL